jgi:hypothetical protein
VDGFAVVHSFQRKRERKGHLDAENGDKRGVVVHRLTTLPKAQNCASDATTCAEAMTAKEGQRRGETVPCEGDGGGSVTVIETLSASDETGERVGFEDGEEWQRTQQSRTP